eukprot:365858-Chlamydomonas_euryale.AAC.7
MCVHARLWDGDSARHARRPAAEPRTRPRVSCHSFGGGVGYATRHENGCVAGAVCVCPYACACVCEQARDVPTTLVCCVGSGRSNRRVPAARCGTGLSSVTTCGVDLLRRRAEHKSRNAQKTSLCLSLALPTPLPCFQSDEDGRGPVLPGLPSKLILISRVRFVHLTSSAPPSCDPSLAYRCCQDSFQPFSSFWGAPRPRAAYGQESQPESELQGADPPGSGPTEGQVSSRSRGYREQTQPACTCTYCISTSSASASRVNLTEASQSHPS